MMTETKAKFAVVIPSYNRGKYIEQAIQRTAAFVQLEAADWREVDSSEKFVHAY